MVRFTALARATDGLVLVATVDESKDEETGVEYQKQAKALVQRLVHAGSTLPLKAAVKTEPLIFYYTVEVGVCFLVLCDKSYPKLLAFSYLMELQNEFFEVFTHSDVQAAMRPYECIKFEPTLSRIRRKYLSPRSLKPPHDLTELSERLQSIKTLSLRDVLGAEYRPFSAHTVYSTLTEATPLKGAAVRTAGQATALGLSVDRWFDLVVALLSLVVAGTALALDAGPAMDALSPPTMDDAQPNISKVSPTATFLYDWMALAAVLVGLYLCVQAVGLIRNKRWADWTATPVGLSVGALSVARLFLWAATGVPRSSGTAALSAAAPGVLLGIMTVLRARSGAATAALTDGVHAD